MYGIQKHPDERMTHETLAPGADGHVDGAGVVDAAEPMLHSSETAWPDGTPAAVFGQNYWALPTGTWQMVSELDDYGCPWHVLDDLETPLLYVPETDGAAFALLTSNGWSRTDNTLLDRAIKPLVDGYERGRFRWLRRLLPKHLR